MSTFGHITKTIWARDLIIGLKQAEYLVFYVVNRIFCSMTFIFFRYDQKLFLRGKNGQKFHIKIF